MPDRNAVVENFTQRFDAIFGGRPNIFRAPGRVNLIGEHTDYNEGFVMPAAVGFSTYAAVGPRPDRKLVIHSEQFPGHFEFDLERLPGKRTGVWSDYALGVAVVLQQHGHSLEGANLLVHGEVPIGSGLSSSAALEVATALALLERNKVRLPRLEIAKLCREAENSFVGARVGIMDQFVACFGNAGHALLLDCRSLEFQPVPVPDRVRLVVCNTMVKHDLATSAYNTRREECEAGVRYFAKWDPRVHALRDLPPDLLQQHARNLDPIIWNRCAHVVNENQRTQAAARALSTSDLSRVGELMRESHRSLRDLYQVSCRELDIMVESAEGLPGFCGGRMTGGGFGGCTVNLVLAEKAEEFAAQIAPRYLQQTGIEPRVYICSAEEGAEALS